MGHADDIQDKDRSDNREWNQLHKLNGQQQERQLKHRL
jgi:hypothetical protein